MKKQLLSIYTRTPLHVGAGSSVGAIDQPIQRERATGFPVIPGSSLKGALADHYSEDVEGGKRKLGSTLHHLFGSDTDEASRGSLSISEAKLLLFPVRSLKGCFAWATSPLALNRFLREYGESPLKIQIEDPQIAYVGTKLQYENNIVLEDYVLVAKENTNIDQVIDRVKPLIPDEGWRDELKEHLVIISDGMLSYFCRNACDVAQHVKIDDQTGTAIGGALFNQENVPSESLFYSVVHCLKSSDTEHFNKFQAKINEIETLQVGADATTGLGYCSVQMNSTSEDKK